MSGLQGYYNTVNNFGSSLDSAQNYLSSYDSDYLNSTLPDFQAKVQEAKEQATGLLEAGATIEGVYVGTKALKATYSAVRKRLSKNDGDEDGTAEEGDETEVGGEEGDLSELGDTGEVGADTVADTTTADTTAADTTTADTAADTTTAEAGGTEDEITAQLQDQFANTGETAATTAEETTSTGLESGTGTSASGTQYFSTEATDEFDLPSGLGEAGDLSIGQDATTASRLADNTILGSGERAGPEILGESTGGGTTGITAEGANIDIPQIQSGGTGTAPEPAPSPADAETGESAAPTETAGEASAETATADTAGATTETTAVAEGTSEATASGLATAAETGGAVAGEVAGDVAATTALDTALGVASVAAEAVPVVGGLVALGIGLFELFHHSSKPKPPPPPQQTTTQKGEVVIPSFDSVVDTPASASAF